MYLAISIGEGHEGQEVWAEILRSAFAGLRKSEAELLGIN